MSGSSPVLMPDYEVAIIGGGPSGAYATRLLAERGWRVALFEKKRLEDIDPCCTGIVGAPYVELVDEARAAVLTEYCSAHIISPSGNVLDVRSDVPRAWSLDRARLERSLLESASRSGAEVLMGREVCRAARCDDGFRFEVGASRGAPCTARAVIIAAGVNPQLTERLGLGRLPRVGVAAHAEIEMDGVYQAEVYLLQHLSRGAFGWLVPVGDGRVRAGVLAGRSARMLLRRLLERADVRTRLRDGSLHVTSRPVPAGTLRRCYADGVLAIGDAAGAAKTTTGGGLYFGALTSVYAAEVVSAALKADDVSGRRLGQYDTMWKHDIMGELRRGSVMRRLYSRMSASAVDLLVRGAARTGAADRLVSSSRFSFDRHSGTLARGLVAGLCGLASALSGPGREAES